MATTTHFQALEQELRKTISQARLEATELPLCPEVKLYLLTANYPRGPLPHEEMLAILEQPAYWAFCWASGHVLARYLLQQPELVSGRTILDFGAGSGVVAIAAMLAGADRAIACDIDPAARLATAANAELNDVEVVLLDDIQHLAEPVDLLIAADVLYDRDNMPFLDDFMNSMPEVLVADSRIKDLHLRGYEILDQVTTTTIPDLDEQKEFNQVKVYRAQK